MIVAITIALAIAAPPVAEPEAGHTAAETSHTGQADAAHERHEKHDAGHRGPNDVEPTHDAHSAHAGHGMKDRMEDAPSDTRDVGIDDSRLNELVPLDVTLIDEDGQPVVLQDLVDGKKPILLTFVYFRCPVICKPLLEFLAGALADLSLTAGQDFHLITVSIDPDETRQLTKVTHQRLLERYGRPATWSFLRGREAAIQRLTRAAGFQYNRVEGTQEFAHPATLIILTPEGRVARYLPGIPEDPKRHAKDIKLALVEAADGDIGSPIDWFVLTCYHFDPERGTYTVQAQRVMMFAGGITALLLALFLAPRWLRDARRSNGEA